MSNTILQMKDVHSYYGESQILFGLNLKVEKGSSVCILGRNGVGKSTTMKSVMGLLNPKSHSRVIGSMLYKDKDCPATRSPTRALPMCRRDVTSSRHFPSRKIC